VLLCGRAPRRLRFFFGFLCGLLQVRPFRWIAGNRGGLGRPSGRSHSFIHMRLLISLFCFLAVPDERLGLVGSYRGIFNLREARSRYAYTHIGVYVHIYMYTYICPDHASESRCWAAQWAAQRPTERSRGFKFWVCIHYAPFLPRMGNGNVWLWYIAASMPLFHRFLPHYGPLQRLRLPHSSLREAAHANIRTKQLN
jgi:hypothetical protein